MSFSVCGTPHKTEVIHPSYWQVPLVKIMDCLTSIMSCSRISFSKGRFLSVCLIGWASGWAFPVVDLCGNESVLPKSLCGLANTCRFCCKNSCAFFALRFVRYLKAMFSWTSIPDVLCFLSLLQRVFIFDTAEQEISFFVIPIQKKYFALLPAPS